MILPPAKPAYSQQDEQQTRNAISQSLQNTVDKRTAQTRMLFIDQDTNETVAVTVESGVLVVTAL